MLLDFEALAHGRAPVILGLGAALFGVDADGFAWAAPCPKASAWPISTKGQEARDLDHSTIGFWLAQPEVVREPVVRALGHGSRAGLVDLRAAILNAWQAASEANVGEWWAKPAAYDLSLWWQLVREHVSATVKVHGRLRDARTLRDAAELATGVRVTEPDLQPKHDPGVDALASACACADALALLIARRTTMNAAFDPE